MTDRNLSPTGIAELEASKGEFFHLVQMNFSSPLYYTTGPRDIDYAGNTYVSNAIISKIPDFSESLKTKPSTISLDFSGAEQASHAIPLTNNYKNVEVYIYRQLAISGETFLVFKGFIDAYDSDEDVKKGTSKLSWKIANHWADWESVNGRLLTDENQQELYPGDLGLQFTGVTEPILKYWGDFSGYQAAVREVTGYAASGSGVIGTSSFRIHVNPGVLDQQIEMDDNQSFIYDWTSGAASQGKLPVAYGEASLPGVPVFRDLSGTRFEFLWVVYVLSEGECQSLTDVLFDGVSYTDPDISSKVSVTFHPGTTTQVVDAALSVASTEWTVAHQLKGVCYAVVKYTYDAEIWSGGEPVPQFILKGKKCAPIGGGAKVWTTDPVEILSDYLTSTIYGKGLSTSDLDDFVAGHSYSSATVTDHDGGDGGTPVSIPRFEFNGVLDTGNSIKKNSGDILDNMLASLPWVNGKYKLVISRNDDTQSYTFNEDNITDTFSVKEAGIKSYANKVYYSFIDPIIDYAESTEFTALSQVEIDAQDNGRILKKTAGSKFETNRYRAKNRSNTLLKMSRDQLTVSLTCCAADSIRNETGDIVGVTRTTQGWTNKLFRITGMTLLRNGNNKFELAFYDPTNFDWNVPAEFNPPPNTSLTDPINLAAPTSLVLSSGTASLLVGNDGSIISRINTSFTIASEVFVAGYELQFKQASESEWVNYPDLQGSDNNQTYVSPVQDGVSYDIRIRSFSNIGGKSTWLTGSHTVIGKTEPPSDVVTFNAYQNGINVVFKWSAITDVDLSGYEIRYATTNGASWEGAKALTKVTKGTNITSADVPPGDLTFFIKAVDTSGNYSVNANSTAMTVTAEQNIIISGVGSPDFTGATLTNLVKHHTGKLVPKSQNLALNDGYDTFDNFVLNPYDTCSIESPEYDVEFNDLVRIWATVDGALGPGETVGQFTTNLELDYRLDAGSYDGFENWSIGQATLRYVKYKLTLDTTQGVAYISEFEPNIDVTETKQSDTNVVIPALGSTITFPNAFHNIPFVKVFLSESSAKFVSRTNITKTGFDCNVFDSTSDVGGVIDWEAID